MFFYLSTSRVLAICLALYRKTTRLVMAAKKEVRCVYFVYLLGW